MRPFPLGNMTVALSQRVRQILAALLLVLGLQLWLVVGHSQWGINLQLKLIALVLVLSPIPWVHRPIGRLLDRVRNPSPRARTIAAFIVAIAAGLYLFYTGHWQGRLLVPHTHDERMYLLQARMLARGRLWMPPHPVGD